MSRAFVKENDGDLPDDLPELPLSPHPNYVTPHGLRLLQERLRLAESQRAAIDDDTVGVVQQRAYLARDIRWLQARIASAQAVTVTADPQRAGFGSVVTLVNEAGNISWVSPLARALQGREVGDELLWPRPAGDWLVEILSIESGPD